MLTKLKALPNSTRFRLAIWYSALFLLLEILLGIIIYIYLFQTSHSNLDTNLKAQARAILRVVEEKHVDLDTFEPGVVYKSEDELIWDIIYEAIVFNRRNTFIQISASKKIIFKTANLGKNILSFPERKEKEIELFDYKNKDLSDDLIRICLLRGKRYNVIVAYPKEFIAQTLNGLRDIYIMIAPLFLIISLLGGSLLSSKSLSRIDAIIKKTEEITAQNLNEKIPGGEYSDEYGRLVNKMNEMIQRIKTSVDFMNQFSISAAHELKTPLTILRGEIELALRSEKLPEDYIRVLKSNHEETIRMIRIIDNLFFISKSDNSQIEISPHEVELDSFLKSIVQSMKVLGNDKNMNLVFEEGPSIKTFFDIDLIKQALSNIIDNAIKFGEENSIIAVSSQIYESKIAITVSNQGEKIPQEEVEKIFNRFYRTEKSRARKTGGVGLGLSVVKSIISLHGGNITVASSDGITKVSIIIPKQTPTKD